jgi:hypothetical protein
MFIHNHLQLFHLSWRVHRRPSERCQNGSIMLMLLHTCQVSYGFFLLYALSRSTHLKCAFYAVIFYPIMSPSLRSRSRLTFPRQTTPASKKSTNHSPYRTIPPQLASLILPLIQALRAGGAATSHSQQSKPHQSPQPQSPTKQTQLQHRCVKPLPRT